MKILVVEDDRRILSFLERGLQAEGFEVRSATDGREGLEMIRQGDLDLVILDRMIPFVDGLTVCRTIHEERLPVLVLMLTAKDSIQDRVDGLRGGADDYLTKPFAFDELLARIDALRRRRPRTDIVTAMTVGPVTLDEASRRVHLDGTEIALTVREFELLRFLMANADKVVSRERLLSSVWGYSFDPGTKVVEVYVRYLRRKLSDQDARIVLTVRGIGYMMTSTPGVSG